MDVMSWQHEVLRPPHRLNVIDEVIGALRQVDKIGIWQIDEPLVHMFLGLAAVERARQLIISWPRSQL